MLCNGVGIVVHYVVIMVDPLGILVDCGVILGNGEGLVDSVGILDHGVWILVDRVGFWWLVR